MLYWKLPKLEATRILKELITGYDMAWVIFLWILSRNSNYDGVRGILFINNFHYISLKYGIV
jgi:hypothetical protein